MYLYYIFDKLLYMYLLAQSTYQGTKQSWLCPFLTVSSIWRD